MSWLTPKADIRQSAIHGEGAFAREEIQRGELVGDFERQLSGVLLSFEEANRLPPALQAYQIQVEDNVFFALARLEDRSGADYINHSCDPNCGMSHALKHVALRDIKPGEELTFDYAMCDSWEYDRMECRCGSPRCRKVILGSDWQIPALQQRYRGHFAPYVQRKIDATKRIPAAVGKENAQRVWK